MYQRYLVVCLCLALFSVMGCNSYSGDPTAPALDVRALQEAPATPSDDTSESEIVTTPYRSYVIAAVGDSITYGEGASRATGGYPGMLETKLRATGYPIDIYNTGEPGATSDEVEARFRQNITGADIALIMIGTNDILNPNACLSPSNCGTIDNIRSMIDTAIRTGVVPVLGTVTPKNPGSDYAFFNPRIEYLNAQIFTLAAAYNIAIVDTYSTVLNNGGASLYVDRNHFTDQGYRVIANEWYRVLTTAVLYSLPGAL